MRRRTTSKPKKKKGRKDLYGIQRAVDTFATNALTQAKGATILKKHKDLLDEAGPHINANEIKDDLVQQHRFQSIIAGSVKSYDNLYEAGVTEEKSAKNVEVATPHCGMLRGSATIGPRSESRTLVLLTPTSRKSQGTMSTVREGS